jgi:hypothetical protein
MIKVIEPSGYFLRIMNDSLAGSIARLDVRQSAESFVCIYELNNHIGEIDLNIDHDCFDERTTYKQYETIRVAALSDIQLQLGLMAMRNN